MKSRIQIVATSGDLNASLSDLGLEVLPCAQLESSARWH
jgi:hypothetical protein